MPAMSMLKRMSSKWTAADVPDQAGRVAIITGANSGLGYDTAAVLAAKGAHVVLAVRNLDKGNEAVDRIKKSSPNAVVELQELDLTSLDSVRQAAGALRTNYPRIDLLINNAGVMYVPTREVTKDGFEMQFGTNHLGHFALDGLLIDNLVGVEGSRVVTVSSFGHKIIAKIHFDDLDFQRGYPEPLWRLFTQPAEKGALGTLRAATDPAAQGGEYYGPDGLGELQGNPQVVKSSAQSHNQDIQRRLWAVSEELTGVTYPV
jgi:NAD(P)-dependent dehydrogenase (short-subunit alcohol dehydrogenase family)